MFITLRVVPANETFIITDPFRIAEEISGGLEKEGALDPMLVFLSQCAQGLSRLFGDVVLFVSFADSIVDDEPVSGAASGSEPFREFFPSTN